MTTNGFCTQSLPCRVQLSPTLSSRPTPVAGDGGSRRLWQWLCSWASALFPFGFAMRDAWLRQPGSAQAGVVGDLSSAHRRHSTLTAAPKPFIAALTLPEKFSMVMVALAAWRRLNPPAAPVLENHSAASAHPPNFRPLRAKEPVIPRRGVPGRVKIDPNPRVRSNVLGDAQGSDLLHPSARMRGRPEAEKAEGGGRCVESDLVRIATGARRTRWARGLRCISPSGEAAV